MQVNAKEEYTRRNKNGLLQACSSGVKEFFFFLPQYNKKVFFLRKVFEILLESN